MTNYLRFPTALIIILATAIPFTSVEAQTVAAARAGAAYATTMIQEGLITVNHIKESCEFHNPVGSLGYCDCMYEAMGLICLGMDSHYNSILCELMVVQTDQDCA